MENKKNLVKNISLLNKLLKKKQRKHELVHKHTHKWLQFLVLLLPSLIFQWFIKWLFILTFNFCCCSKRYSFTCVYLTNKKQNYIKFVVLWCICLAVPWLDERTSEMLDRITLIGLNSRRCYLSPSLFFNNLN